MSTFVPRPALSWHSHTTLVRDKDDGGGKHRAFSQCVYVLRTLTVGDIGGRKENTDGTAPAFGKCPAFLCFKQLVVDPGRVHKLLGTRRESEIFLGEEVLDASDRGLFGTRKFDQSA